MVSEEGVGNRFKLVKEPVVEDYSLQCDNPVTAMTLDKDYILVGLNNAKVNCGISKEPVSLCVLHYN